MRIRDWSSDVCSSDLKRSCRAKNAARRSTRLLRPATPRLSSRDLFPGPTAASSPARTRSGGQRTVPTHTAVVPRLVLGTHWPQPRVLLCQFGFRPSGNPQDAHLQKRSDGKGIGSRSEEHTSELQSLMSISYAV